MSINYLTKYSPVSNLSSIFIILEKLVASYLGYIVALDLIFKVLQFAYKHFHYTDTGLLSVHNDVTFVTLN